MKKHFILSIVSLIVLGFVVGGSVIAYFSDESSASTTQFVLGTVAIEQDGELDVEIVTEEGDSCDNTGDKSGVVTWNIKNIGSKTSFLRVRLNDWWTCLPEDPQGKEETAWGFGTKVEDKPGFRPMYFTYNFGAAPISVDLIAAQHDHVGWVRVWTTEDGGLKVKYETKQGYSLKEMHLWVGHDETKLIKLGRGQYPYANKDADWGGPGSNTAVFTIPKKDFDKTKLIKIAAHSVVYYPVTSGVTYYGASGQLPNIEKTVLSEGWKKGSDDYWYYLNPVVPGQSVTFKIEIKKADPTWKGSGTYGFKLEAQAVQASHNAIDAVWPDHPVD